MINRLVPGLLALVFNQYPNQYPSQYHYSLHSPPCLSNISMILDIIFQTETIFIEGGDILAIEIN